MNYEEMLDSREGVATHHEDLPIGTFYKKLIEKKYRYVVEIRPELVDCIVFCEALKADAILTDTLVHPAQLHFKIKEDSSGIYEIELDSGNYQSFEQLLTQNPAVVTGKDYIDHVISQLASVLKCLHEQNVYQCCLSPKTVFARKNDNMPMLLWHGSFFNSMNNKESLYQGFEDYVAPEVVNGDSVDERSDVYSLGKFIERLHADGSMPFEYRKVVAKATETDPSCRYASVDEMIDAVGRRRNFLRSGIMALAAVAIALLCIGLYIEALPEPVDVDYVKPANEGIVQDPYDASLTPTELGLDVSDTILMSDEERAEMEELEAEVERIFRRQFKQETERVFSKMYSKDRMSSSEQSFISGNNTMMDELLRKRDALATQAGISADKAESISKQIMSEVQTQKQKVLKKYGYQPAGDKSE